METTLTDCKNAARVTSSVSTASTGSNQLYIAENLELDLPEDTFRMNLNNFSVIGENVTIGERGSSIDTITLGTPVLETQTSLQTPDIQTPIEERPHVLDTPTQGETKRNDNIITPKLLKLSQTENHDHDMFIKPSPVAEVMSPARMLQYEIASATPYTPTMIRAAIDFDFFNKNQLDEYFDNLPKEKKTELKAEKIEMIEDNSSYETTVIVNPNTVRHEINDGKFH